MGNFNYILIAIAVAVGPAVRVYLGRRNSKRYSVSTEGAVRVRAPRFPLIAVIILAPVGIALNVVGVFCLWFSIQAWMYSQDTSLFSYEDTAWVFLLALMSLAGGIFLSSLSYLMIMSLKNEYVETGIDYVEKRGRLGKVTRIFFQEISSYDYDVDSEGGVLTVGAADGREISFEVDYYRGDYVMAAIAIRKANGCWFDPTDEAVHQRLVQIASDGTARRYIREHPCDDDLNVSCGS